MAPTDYMASSLITSSEVATLQPKWSGIGVCYGLFFCAMLSFTVMETLLTPILQAELGLSQSMAIKYASIFMAASSVICLLPFVSPKNKCQFHDQSNYIRLRILLMESYFEFFLEHSVDYSICGFRKR